MALIYIETTIPSFYYESRTEPEMVARRNWTREWWEQAVRRERLVTGPPVIAELERGEFPARHEALTLVGALPVIEISEPVAEIAAAYIAHKVMPADPAGDALHLALAAYHNCDFLATWNCRHLANARKFQHIRRVNAILGIQTPALVTPLELFGEEDTG